MKDWKSEKFGKFEYLRSVGLEECNWKCVRLEVCQIGSMEVCKSVRV